MTKLVFELVMENKNKNRLAEARDEEIKNWLTISYQETRKTPQGIQERFKTHPVLGTEQLDHAR